MLSIAVVAALLAASAPQSPDASPPAFDGDWSGTATLSFDHDTGTCRYEPEADAHPITVRLSSSGTAGSVSLDFPAEGEECPAIKHDYVVMASHSTGNSLSLTDDAGQVWSLTLREGRLKGLVSAPHMTGEVDLAPGRPPGTAAAPPEASGASKAPAKPAGGSVLKGTAGFVAANVVGLGALVGLNYALKDSQQSTTTPKCSWRACVVIVAGDECQCDNATLIDGQDCGTTTTGVPYAGVCNPPSLPCQRNLSCNNGICEDAAGRCRF